jgi:hypothetical protein
MLCSERGDCRNTAVMKLLTIMMYQCPKPSKV